MLATYLGSARARRCSASTLPASGCTRGWSGPLERALATREVAVGLGTGNIKGGARIKLERVKIHDHFGFGGFGCDARTAPSSSASAPSAARRGSGLPLAECRVVVIGDTPKDVAAAQAIGAESIGVGTGSFTAEQLRACGATFAFPSLAEPGALEALLSDGTAR